MDPATDTYYYWLCTISVPVFYNLIFLVARFERRYPSLAKRVALSFQTSRLPVVASSRACFNELQSANRVLWLSLDHTSDLFYCIDTFMRVRTGGLTERSSLSNGA